MPARFIKKHGAVIVENHLNMIRAAANVRPKVSTAVVSAILNSTIIDEAFRCISGSVAVSAFELESLPLPPPEEMQHLASLIKRRATVETIQQHIRALYIGQG
jgi:adenine-specific DNA-methyltransferase